MMPIEALLAPLRRRVRALVSRAVVKLVDDSLKMQGVQVALLAGEVADNVERFQNFGFTGVPLPGAEGIALAVGGDAGHLVLIAVDDRKWRPTGWQAGESGVYNAFQCVIRLKADGSIEVNAPTGITLDPLGAGLTKGVVQGDCICAFTGGPHPMTSLTVKASL